MIDKSWIRDNNQRSQIFQKVLGRRLLKNMLMLKSKCVVFAKGISICIDMSCLQFMLTMTGTNTYEGWGRDKKRGPLGHMLLNAYVRQKLCIWEKYVKTISTCKNIINQIKLSINFLDFYKLPLFSHNCFFLPVNQN